jgi:hypothetical protein
MPFPVAKVEIAFDDGPYTASPRWTDVTSYVRELTVDRGRDDDWGTFSGDAMVVLDNRTRLFDPFYTSGTYYGKLLPRRQIRITATTALSATVYPVFRGFIQGWPPTWTDAGKDSTVTLSCMDALGLLASETLPADWSRNYILSTSPRHYYPCDDPVGPYTANQTLTDIGSVPLNMVTSSTASNGDQLAVGLTNRCIVGTGSEAATSSAGSTLNASASFTISVWAVPDASTLPFTPFVRGNYGNMFYYFGYNTTTGKFYVEVDEGSFANARLATTTISGWDSGVARMFSFSYNNSTRAIIIYIDGVVVASTNSDSALISIASPETINIAYGQVQQLVMWDGVQTQAVLQDIYKYSTVNLPETTAARFTRLIAETAFPASLTSGPSAPASSVLDITDDAPKLAGELQRVADSEYAPLFVDRSGVVTLYNQNQIRTQTRSIVSQGTYGTGGYSIGQDVSIAYDGDSMRNEANITMSGGGVYIGKNTTSVTAYGAAQESLDTQVSTLADATDIGNIVTGWGGQVYPKADPFEVVLSPSADWSNALDRELNDRITLVVSPPTGNSITSPMLVSRISHSVVPGEWRTTFEGSARWAAVFILNTSTLGGTDLLG